jgi:predicted benzoate:H+ symporter BenE
VRRVRAPSPMAALVVFVVTMAGMALTGAPPWAMLLAIAVLTLLPTEERD